MTNGLNSKTDQERLREIARRLGVNQTDVTRLWGRIGQYSDSAGEPISGPATPSAAAYTPAAGPTTTPTPTTSTTTTPAPMTIYLYPRWDRLVGPDVILSSGSEVWSLLGDNYGDDWPDHANYIHCGDGQQLDFSVLVEVPVLFRWLSGIEFQCYTKNELPSAPLVFDVAVRDSENTFSLVGSDAITGVGVSESGYNLVTQALTLNAEAYDWKNWVDAFLSVDVQADTEAGSPSFHLSGVRLKVSLTPLGAP